MVTSDPIGHEKSVGVCIPEGAKSLQWAKVVVKWLNDHPEKLHDPAVIAVYLAMKEAFPCGEK